MGGRLIPDRHHTISRAWEWYEVQRQALFGLRSRIQEEQINGVPVSIPQVQGFTPAEFRRYMDRQFLELEFLAAFNMLSATEALLFRDFKFRRHNAAGAVASSFRRLDKKLREVDKIIDVWRGNLSNAQGSYFSNFRSAMNYRHWVAHGRHFEAKAHQYPPALIFDICTKVEEAVNA
jgi:hypothetical protein